MELDQARMTERLDRMVAIPTENPPGREIECAELIASWLVGMGGEPAVDLIGEGRANVAAVFRNGEGPTFAFNSHIDVVPAGSGWVRDPFRLTKDGDRLYGRGSCDAKGSIAGMLEAVEAMLAERGRWSGTLVAVFVADEETSSHGAKAYAAKRPTVDYAVIGEPTGNGTVTAHKGSLRPWVRVKGVAAHSGMPQLGVNAVINAARLVGAFDAHAQQVVRHRHHPLCGCASLTITRMRGGHADNVVPDACEFMIDRRMVPGEDADAVRAEIFGILDAARREYGIEAEIATWQETTGAATETDPAAPIVAAALDAGRRHGAAATEPFGFQGGCDLVHFASLGADGVVMGPGSLDVAHKPDEFVEIDQFVRSAAIYRDVAMRMLGGHATPAF
ncbi:MAG: M20 family metallopeptidase [Alphaproteobacteria bacterium]